jgi:SAM-dependent methyltransferase
MKVLDCACGPATILPYLPDVDYVGIDLNAKHIAYARALYGERGRFIHGDATKDLGDELSSFDLIILSGLLHHLSDESARKVLAAAKTLAKPGSRIATMDSIWLENQHPVAWALNKLDSGLNVRTAEGYLSLAEGLDVKVESRVYRDFFRIPFDHFCMTLTLRNSTSTKWGIQT